MARIAIDCRMWNESGVGRYIRNLVFYLQKFDKTNEYFILHKKTDYDTLVYYNNFHKILADFGWYGVSEQIKLPGIIKKLNPDLVHFPHFNVPIFYNSSLSRITSFAYSGKFVVTIHDLIHQHFQMRRATTRDPFTYKLKNLGYKTVLSSALRKSFKVITPSNYVKDQLISGWNIDENKIVVTPEGVDTKLLTIIGSLANNKQKTIFDKYGIKFPYIFYVGNAHPHKNVEGLIKAFLKIKDRHSELGSESQRSRKNFGMTDNEIGLQLVLSGNDHYFWQKIKQVCSMDPRFRGDDIVFTGFVTDEELVALYKNAECFIMPSFEEGFGIPILESFAIGTPVVSSNAGSLPEVAGDAAIFFNPQDIEDITDKISNILNNENLRKELIKKGKERVKQFSWEKMTKQTLEVYQKCV